MGGRVALAVVAVAAGLVVSTAVAATRASDYTLAGTRACLSRQAGSIPGVPPANPPTPPALFFGATGKTTLGAWYGVKSYAGIVFQFYASAAGARKNYDPPYNRLMRNVIATWSVKKPSKPVQQQIVGCLRGGSAATVSHPVPHASLATFAGYWEGHTRALSITAKGGGGESASSGCCSREYELAFQIRSVTGTLTHATAVIRVTAFKRYDSSVKRVRVGETGKLELRNGIVTDTLTRDTFCSGPAGIACGA